MNKGGANIAAAIEQAEGLAIAAYLTAGFPSVRTFLEAASQLSREADVVEIGIPFSDPIADGPTIQRASAAALAGGVRLEDALAAALRVSSNAPAVLMSYLNPILARGVVRFAELAAAAKVAGVIIPDLPLEESTEIELIMNGFDIALIQLVSPITPQLRVQRICQQTDGFVYAVATTGVTGGTTVTNTRLIEYLDRVRSVAVTPVMAGFGIRTASQAAALSAHVDGIVVGSALVEVLEQDDDP
ncbi:MAG: tryptophan synthase subunit alpha, partial [Gemmatimonadales bacterium]